MPEEAVEHLKLQKEIDNDNDSKHNRAKTPDSLNEMLKAIQLSLARIECREVITSPKPKSYAVAAAAPSPAIAKQVPKDKVPTPKETRRAREITVHITNEAEKERLKALLTKNLIEALQADTSNIGGIT